MRIEHYAGLNRTPALRLALMAQLDLMEQGMTTNTLMVGWDHQAIVAFDEQDQPVGVLTWEHHAWLKEVSIALGYVVPAARRQGIYRQMWDALVVKAREAGALEITSATHVNNRRMRSASSALGRRERAVMMVYDILPEAKS